MLKIKNISKGAYAQMIIISPLKKHPTTVLPVVDAPSKIVSQAWGFISENQALKRYKSKATALYGLKLFLFYYAPAFVQAVFYGLF